MKRTNHGVYSKRYDGSVSNGIGDDLVGALVDVSGSDIDDCRPRDCILWNGGHVSIRRDAEDRTVVIGVSNSDNDGGLMDEYRETNFKIATVTTAQRTKRLQLATPTGTFAVISICVTNIIKSSREFVDSCHYQRDSGRSLTIQHASELHCSTQLIHTKVKTYTNGIQSHINNLKSAHLKLLPPFESPFAAEYSDWMTYMVRLLLPKSASVATRMKMGVLTGRLSERVLL